MATSPTSAPGQIHAAQHGQVIQTEQQHPCCLICRDDEDTQPLIPLHYASTATRANSIPHLFHANCIIPMARIEGVRVVCPICREKMSIEETFPHAENAPELRERFRARIPREPQQPQINLVDLGIIQRANAQFLQQPQIQIHLAERDLGPVLGRVHFLVPLTHSEIRYLQAYALFCLSYLGLWYYSWQNPQLTGGDISVRLEAFDAVRNAITQNFIDVPASSVIQRVRNVAQNFIPGIPGVVGSIIGNAAGSYFGYPIIGSLLGGAIGNMIVRGRYTFNRMRNPTNQFRTVAEIDPVVLEHAIQRGFLGGVDLVSRLSRMFFRRYI